MLTASVVWRLYYRELSENKGRYIQTGQLFFPEKGKRTILINLFYCILIYHFKHCLLCAAIFCLCITFQACTIGLFCEVLPMHPQRSVVMHHFTRMICIGAACTWRQSSVAIQKRGVHVYSLSKEHKLPGKAFHWNPVVDCTDRVIV